MIIGVPQKTCNIYQNLFFTTQYPTHPSTSGIFRQCIRKSALSWSFNATRIPWHKKRRWPSCASKALPEIHKAGNLRMLVIIVTRWEECPTPMVFAEATCISSAAFTSKPTSRPEASLDPGEVSSNMGWWKAQEDVQQFGAQDSKLQQSNAHAYVTLFLFLLGCASRNPVIVSDNHTISQLRTQLQRWDIPKLHVGVILH